MAFSSVRDMVELCKETGQPLYEIILESDLTESGLTRAESEAEMHRLWSVMCSTSAGYCSTDRSMSGFAGGDAAFPSPFRRNRRRRCCPRSSRYKAWPCFR